MLAVHKKYVLSIWTTTALRSYFHHTFNVPMPYLFRRIYYLDDYNFVLYFCRSIFSLFFSLHLIVFFRHLFIIVAFSSLCSLPFFVAVLACFFLSLFSLLCHCIASPHCSRYFFLVIVLVTYFRHHFLFAYFVHRFSHCLMRRRRATSLA